MAYTAPQIGTILLKADRTMYKIGQIAYENMFAEDNEALDYERDIIFIYKKAVEYADDFFIGTEKLDKVVERLAAKISAYDYGELNPIYADAALLNISTVVAGAALNDLTDVTITNVQDNQLLRYNSVTGQWINVGPGSAVRNSQAFTATAGQTVFTTSFPFDAGLFDLYLNGVKLNSSSYTTFGEYQITLNDACLVGDIVDVVIFDPNTSILPSINSLDDLVDVSLGALVNNQVLYYNSATGLWQNGTVSGGVWGSITGTLSNQTDLQNALNAKYNNPTGTTSQYLRGDGSLATFPAIPSGTVTSVGLTMPSAFSVAGSPITSSGTLAVTATGDTTQYIAGDGSLVAFPITGQAGTLVREVRNVTGATLTKGTVCYINGASGNRPTVAKALATGDATSAQTFGLIQADIANNSNGYLVAFGDLDGLNTSAFAEGVQLYLSSTTAGGYTSTKQYAPNHLVYIGVVTRQHVNQGRIEVRIQNGYEMDELHDVAAQTPSNNDGLFYNSTNSLWENKSIATALGYTPANAATTLTINGVTYDLSTSRSWSVGSVTGTGASGQVAYWTGASAQSGSNDLFWDSANGRLGIGTNAPISGIDVRNRLRVTGTSGIVGAIGSNTYGLSVQNNASASWIEILNNGGVDKGVFFGISNDRTANTFELWNYQGGAIDFYNAATATSGTRKLRIWNNGNVTIQDAGSYTDGGQRLQVQGTTLLNGNVSVSGSTTASSAIARGVNLTSTLVAAANNDVLVGLDIQPTFTNGAFTGVRNIPLRVGGTTVTQGGFGDTSARVRTLISNLESGTYTQLAIQGPTNGGGAVEIYDGSGNAVADFGMNTSAKEFGFVNRMTSGFINLYTHNGTSLASRFHISTLGNVLIQNGGTFTDSGERLQVTGDVKIVGSGTSSATSALRVLNSASTSLLNARNDGEVFIGSGQWVVIGAAQRYIYRNGLTGIFSVANDGNTSCRLDLYGSSHATKPSTSSLVSFFTPTSGSIAFAGFEIVPTINQTGGANGITRGLYVNPTLTATADFRAIETTAGNVLFGSEFFWDNTNSRLGVGTNAPQRPLHIYSNSGMWVQSPTGGNSILVITPTGFDTLNQNFIDFSITANSKMRLFSTGNLALGSTTDSGERLQVTGTMKVTGATTLGTTAASNITTIATSGSSNCLNITNAAGTFVFGVDSFGGYAQPSTASRGMWIYNSAANAYIGADASGCIAINTRSPSASAILDITSTAKGFLPPRGTNAQMLAIASPATGLVFYDTTNNKLNCYDGTTWQPCW